MALITKVRSTPLLMPAVGSSITFTIDSDPTWASTGQVVQITNSDLSPELVGYFTVISFTYNTKSASSISGRSGRTLTLENSSIFSAYNISVGSFIPDGSTVGPAGFGGGGTPGATGSQGFTGPQGATGDVINISYGGVTGPQGLTGPGMVVTNPSPSRVLTSDGTSFGVNAQENLTFDGSLLTVTGSAIISGTLSVSGHLIPTQDSVFDLGATPSGRWRDLWLSGNTIYLGDAKIASTGSSINVESIYIGTGEDPVLISASGGGLSIAGSSTQSYAFPYYDGLADQFIFTDGNGNLGWTYSLGGGGSGSQGPQGFTGPQGLTGSQGLTGPQGFQGSTGAIEPITLNEVAFGTGTGLTSSSNFKFESICNNLIVSSKGAEIINSPNSVIVGGDCKNSVGTSSNSSIIGGCCNTLICSSYNSSIIAGQNNTLSYNSFNSSIIGGISNKITLSARYSSIIGGGVNTLTSYVGQSSIIGGYYNTLSCYGYLSSIIGGQSNTLTCYSSCSSIIEGFKTQIISSAGSIILGSRNSSIECTTLSVLIGGCCNYIKDYSPYSSIIAGNNNTLKDASDNSFITGGSHNTVCCSKTSAIIASYCSVVTEGDRSFIAGGDNNANQGQSSIIIGGSTNKIYQTQNRNSIIGGSTNTIQVYDGVDSYNSSIIGGESNKLNGVCNSAIIGGNGLCLYTNETVLVKNLSVAGTISPNNGVEFGTSGTFFIGSATFSICNGVITNIIQ